MDEDTPDPEPEKPRFLLPDGCKDLIDVLRLRQEASEAESSRAQAGSVSYFPFSKEQMAKEAALYGKVLAAASNSSQPRPEIIAIPDPVRVFDLAIALHLKPFEIIGSLIKLNVVVPLSAPFSAQVDFGTASALCALYGVVAVKVP